MNTTLDTPATEAPATAPRKSRVWRYVGIAFAALVLVGLVSNAINGNEDTSTGLVADSGTIGSGRSAADYGTTGTPELSTDEEITMLDAAWATTDGRETCDAVGDLADTGMEHTAIVDMAMSSFFDGYTSPMSTPGKVHLRALITGCL